MPLETMKKSPRADDSAMDLSSLKEFWVIVHFKECDPGNEYEILNDVCIESDSWETLARGVDVCVKFGNARVQGHVVVISDDLLYLQSNFQSLTDEYTSEHYGDSNYFRKKDKRPSKHSFYESYPITKQVIKVADKETQTDSTTDSMTVEDYATLKFKYEKLQEVVKTLTDNITIASKIAVEENKKLDINKNEDKEILCKREKSEFHERCSKPNPFKSRENIEVPSLKQNNRNIVITDNDVFIGHNKTQIPRSVFENINWHNYSGATRKLLMSVFPRNILATHTLTGKPNPAFRKNKISTQKMRLDPAKITDIIETVTMKCHVSESLVRSAITTKCADENKMFRIRMDRKGHDETENNDPNSENKRIPLTLSNKRKFS